MIWAAMDELHADEPSMSRLKILIQSARPWAFWRERQNSIPGLGRSLPVMSCGNYKRLSKSVLFGWVKARKRQMASKEPPIRHSGPFGMSASRVIVIFFSEVVL